jgi:hypothetical protein
LDETTVLPTVEEVTGRPPRTFREWSQAHAVVSGPGRSKSCVTSRCEHALGEPAVLSQGSPPPGADRAARLQELLGLGEDELCTILGVEALTLMSGQLEHRPELPILVDLLAEAEQRAGQAVLRRWVRTAGPGGRPIDQLLARDFAAFEDSVAALAERGFVLRGGG